MRTHFGVLGAFEISGGGPDGSPRPRSLGRTKPKLVLALLLMNANRPVPLRYLARELWGDEPPRSAVANIYTYVSAIRQVLADEGEDGRLTTSTARYTLAVETADLDALTYRKLGKQGRQELRRGDPVAAARLLAAAVDLWRGPPLADLPRSPGLTRWAGALQEHHAALLRDWTDARLRLGEADELVGEVRQAVAGDPLCERSQVQLMLALYRAGRTAEALHAYADARHLLVEELGLEPGPLLTRIHRAILRRDPSLSASDSVTWLPASAP